MPLESATYIHQLDVSNPASTDQLQSADDHLRLIKAAIKATFPNIEGAVTSTHEELNSIPSAIPVGLISVWYGSSSSVPEGWAICNGQTVARSDGSGNITVPDLRDRVVLGASSTYPQGTTQGVSSASATTASSGAHTHTTDAQGAHTHTASISGTTGATAVSIESTTDPVDGSGGFEVVVSATSPAHTHSFSGSGTTDSQGSHTHTAQEAGSHTHTVSVSTMQPSLALHWIMKV